jgi:hypothetical protein
MDAPEEPVDFADTNAKLIVLEALCYDLDVLQPYAGAAHEEAEDEDEEVEGLGRLAREYYDDLDVLPSHLALVTSITVDGDLQIYGDVDPDWSGDDDRHDPLTWSDITELPALETVWTSAPLPAHVDTALRARGVVVETS